MRQAFIFLALISTGAFATDCNSDCEGHFPEWYQAYDYGRCCAERELACQSGLNSCSDWEMGGQVAVDYHAAIKAIEVSTRETGYPKDVHQCYAAVDNAGLGVSGAGGTAFAYKLLVLGESIWKLLNLKALGWQTAIQEGVKHFADCACKAANYPDPEKEIPQNDGYVVTMIGGNGGWGTRWGDNTPQKRSELYGELKNFIIGGVSKVQVSYFSQNLPTISEVMCKQGSFYRQGLGYLSIKKGADEVFKNKWQACVIRTTDFPADRRPLGINDMAGFSIRSSAKGTWAVNWGPLNAAAAVRESALKAVPGADFTDATVFSSSRPTSTTATCEVKALIDAGVVPPDDSTHEASKPVTFVTGGIGSGSLNHAQKIAREKHPKRHCFFKVHDVTFGPLQEIYPEGMKAPNVPQGAY